MMFARARSHHHLASVIERPAGSTVWTWRRPELFGADPKFPDAAGERVYAQVLSGKPVAATLAAAERAVDRLGSDAVDAPAS
jgi:hypothetical protein